MGSSASKASRAATGPATRKYPTRFPTPPSTKPASHQPSSTAPPAPPTGPSVHPPPQASNSRSAAIDQDASDPDFAQSLRSLGPVQPNPTLSPSSTFPSPHNQTRPDPRKNPAIMVLDSRARLQDRADREFLEAGRRGHEGKEFLDVFIIARVLRLRDEQGKSAGEIERVLGLKKGVVGRLGEKGVVSVVDEAGRAGKGVDLV